MFPYWVHSGHMGLTDPDTELVATVSNAPWGSSPAWSTPSPPPRSVARADIAEVSAAVQSTWAATADSETASKPRLTDVTVPATCTFPQAYLLVDIDSRGTTVRLGPQQLPATPCSGRRSRYACRSPSFRS